MADQEKRNKQNRLLIPMNCIEDFHRHLLYNSCFPQSEILDWFSHTSDRPKVRISLPPNLYDDPMWTGLALFVSFSVLFGSLDSQVHCRFGFVSQNGTFGLGCPYSYCLLEEDLNLLKLDGFMWLSYIPSGWFPKWLNRCSSIEISFSNCPNLMVHKCGLQLLYQNDEEKFREIIRLCKSSFSNNYENEGKASTSNTFNDEDTHPERFGSNEDLHNKASIRPRNQCNLPDFDPCLVYDSCFPPNEILEWFSHRSDEPQMIIYLPPNLYDDPSWKGLALCVSFSLQEQGTTIVDNLDSQVPCNQLTFLLETAIGSLEPLHKYCPTEEDLTVLRLGGFIWLSYIPRGSFPNWLIHSNFIEASIATGIPGLTLHKCGFCLLYENEERVSGNKDPLIPGLKTRAKMIRTTKVTCRTSIDALSIIFDFLQMKFWTVEEHGTTIVNNRNLPAPCGFVICEFIWLSYIPREFLRNRLNHSSFIEASIGTDLPGLTVQKCGFHLLYENEEIEFKEIIRQLSQTRDGGMSVIN
ncbi:hypothetical protein FH972_018269 [Carpinus fangiana]|uniref:C-JID domain-containing protein n=1 Tax=Carpinus fangiana TaxID=176857 RepID=A0A5N6RLG2_9ROSI|nr:hypothetical protein FH972_018269 [Carpinus fangiana]